MNARVFLGLVFALLVTSSTRAWADGYVPPPIQGYVTDTALVLSKEEVAALDQKLASYRACSTNHVVVFVVGTLGAYSVEDVAYGAFNTWKIGDAKTDNGVLLVLAPKEHRLKIETGKGVGDRLTDIESSHILRDVATPRMKAGQYYDAANEGTNAIGRALGGCAMTPVTVAPGRTMPVSAAPAAPPAPEPRDVLLDLHLAAWGAFIASLFGLTLRGQRRKRKSVFESVGSAFIAAVFALIGGGIASLIVSVALGRWFGIGFLVLGCLVAFYVAFLLPDPLPRWAKKAGLYGFYGLLASFIGGVTFFVVNGIVGMWPAILFVVLEAGVGLVAVLKKPDRDSASGGASYGGSSSSDTTSYSSSSSSSSSDSGFSSSSSSSSVDTSYSGGGGSSGGGGASDSY